MEQVTADRLHEILQRVKRTETRVVTLGLKLGHQLTEEAEIQFATGENPKAGNVEVAILPSLDIPLSTLLKAARRAEKWGVIPMLYENKMVGTLVVSREG